MARRSNLIIMTLIIIALGAIMPLSAQASDVDEHAKPPIYMPTNVAVLTDLTQAPVRPSIAWDYTEDVTHYGIALQTAAGELIFYEWFSIDALVCAAQCAPGNNAALMDTLFNPWGLLNGDYELWVASYVPDGDIITWSGGQYTEPYEFTVDVAAPVVETLLADWPLAMPVIAFDYDPMTTLWVQLYVGGGAANETYTIWVDVQNNPGCGVETGGDDEACFILGATYLPIYWAPDTYQVWAQAWGPWGFSSPDGTDSAASWQQADYGGNPGLVFPAEAPLTTDAIIAGVEFHPSMGIAWESVENATWHRVVITQDNSIVYDEWHHNANLNCHLGVCGLLVDGLPDNTIYAITISGWGPGGMSENAAQINFDFTP